MTKKEKAAIVKDYLEKYAVAYPTLNDNYESVSKVFTGAIQYAWKTFNTLLMLDPEHTKNCDEIQKLLIRLNKLIS